MSPKIHAKFLIIGVLLLLSISNIAFAAGLVPQCDPVAPIGSPNRCGLCHVLLLGKNLIVFMIELSVTLSVVFIIWGAFVIMTAGGSPERVSQGRQSMTIAVTGVAIALGAWLIIGTLLNIVTKSPSALPWTQIQCQ